MRNVPRLVEKSTTGTEKRPIVVAFLDGDTPGQTVAQELEGKKLLESEFIGTIADVGLTPAWNPAPKELEDIVPPKMLAAAICKYLKTEWREEGFGQSEIEAAIGDSTNGDTMAKRVVKATKDKAGAEAASLTDIEIKGAVFQSFVDCLMNTNEFGANVDMTSALAEFETNIRGVCRKLQLMLTAAETRSRRDRLLKNVRLAIERFEKSSGKRATKADVDRCLRRIDDECTGNTEPARIARENVIQLRNILDEEVVSAGEYVTIESWLARLRKLWDAPWRQEKSGWK